MKITFSRIPLILQFFILFIFAGCEEDNVGPQAGIVADKYLAEPGEEITFTSSSSNLRDYEWTLGNGVTSRKKSVKTTYNTPGEYTVKLKVKDKDGKTNETNILVYIGKFYLNGMSLGTLNFKDSNGNVWDTDGTGPDLNLGFTIPGIITHGWFIGNNITQKNLPAQLTMNYTLSALPNSNCSMTLVEEDPANIAPVRIIKSWQFNPIQEIQKKGRGKDGQIFMSGNYPLVGFTYTVK